LFCEISLSGRHPTEQVITQGKAVSVDFSVVVPSLKSFLNWLVRLKVLTSNPVKIGSYIPKSE
jgi:hypothetical protein